MKALLLRVGIDYGYGALSPIFKDNSYEYIPIYYKNKKLNEENEKRTYKDINCQNQNNGFENLASYLPTKLHNKIIHYDPEFETFTYGEPTFPKRAALLKLEKGDLLVFYLGGKKWDDKKDNEIGVYIFGYFSVDEIFEWNILSEDEHKKLSRKKLHNNAHIISSKPRTNLVIVKGSKEKSKKLKNCIKISEPNLDGNNPRYVTSRKIQKLLGIRKHITRAVPIWITEENYILNLQKLLSINSVK